MPIPNSAAVALDARNSAEGMRTRMPLAVRKDIVRLRREQIEAERHVQHPTLSDVRNDRVHSRIRRQQTIPARSRPLRGIDRYRWRRCCPLPWFNRPRLINLKKLRTN